MPAARLTGHSNDARLRETDVEEEKIFTMTKQNNNVRLKESYYTL